MPAKKKTAAKKKAPVSQPAIKARVTRKAAAGTVPAKGVPKKKSADAKKVTRKSTTLAKKTPKKKPAPKRGPGEAAIAAAAGPIKKRAPYQQAKGEEYMSDRMKQHFRGSLLSWKQELMEEVDRTVHHMQDEAANFPDPNDRATQESEFSLELRTRDRERKLIKKIDEALQAIDADDYGYCDTCGVEIGVRRLEARPTATQCIDCKTLDEIREKQMGG